MRWDSHPGRNRFVVTILPCSKDLRRDFWRHLHRGMDVDQCLTKSEDLPSHPDVHLYGNNLKWIILVPSIPLSNTRITIQHTSSNGRFVHCYLYGWTEGYGTWPLKVLSEWPLKQMPSVKEDGLQDTLPKGFGCEQSHCAELCVPDIKFFSKSIRNSQQNLRQDAVYKLRCRLKHLRQILTLHDEFSHLSWELWDLQMVQLRLVYLNTHFFLQMFEGETARRSGNDLRNTINIE